MENKEIKLFNVTTSEVIDNLINEVMELCNVSTKKLAKAIVLNSLLANCVSKEVVNQAKFLIDCGGYSNV